MADHVGVVTAQDSLVAALDAARARRSAQQARRAELEQLVNSADVPVAQRLAAAEELRSLLDSAAEEAAELIDALQTVVDEQRAGGSKPEPQ